MRINYNSGTSQPIYQKVGFDKKGFDEINSPSRFWVKLEERLGKELKQICMFISNPIFVGVGRSTNMTDTSNTNQLLCIGFKVLYGGRGNFKYMQMFAAIQ